MHVAPKTWHASLKNRAAEMNRWRGADHAKSPPPPPTNTLQSLPALRHCSKDHPPSMAETTKNKGINLTCYWFEDRIHTWLQLSHTHKLSLFFFYSSQTKYEESCSCEVPKQNDKVLPRLLDKSISVICLLCQKKVD